MYKPVLSMCLLVIAAMALVPPAHANVPGAIFTTVADGSEVNYNIYLNKLDVYLDGGPGPGAPEGAAGLPNGDYIFMVTDPSGKTLLSQDIAACRRFTVSGGDITTLVTTDCGSPHATYSLTDGITVQLMPYADTPNHGNEYKVWATPIGNYPASCLTTIDCGPGTHGFDPRYSKTDNFKVKVSGIREIDTRFIDSDTGNFIDGLGITWTDTNGASNNKWSYYSQTLDVNHEAHVEAPENGTHTIVIQNQTGCTAGAIYLNGSLLPKGGPQSVSVKVLPSYKNITLRVDVYCQQ